MAQKNARQLETGVAGDTYYGELFLVLILSATADQRFNFFLEGLADFCPA